MEVYEAGSLIVGDTGSYGHDSPLAAWLDVLRLGSGDGAALSLLASSKVSDGSHNGKH